MDTFKVFRHEYKYHLNRGQMYKLRDSLANVLTIDRGINGYMVRSLYFDSINDIDYYDKLNGNYSKKKIRLRIYDNNPNVVKLEIKKKYDFHQFKESLLISKEDAISIINGNYECLLKIGNDVSLELYEIMMSNCYRPKCIIEYKRIAFMGNGSTRITIDYDIKKSNDIWSFFDGYINYYDLISANEVLLEVKYDYFLESYVSTILNKYISNNESISKYLMGRDVNL